MGFELNYQSSEKYITEVIKTEKYWVHTNHGKLLDTMMGNSAFIFGYDNKHIKDRMREVQDKIAFLNFKHNEICEENEELINKICELGNYSALGWAVSGSDGVECALAINDYYWETLREDKPQVVSFSPGYHGSTYIAKMMRREAPGHDKITQTNGDIPKSCCGPPVCFHCGDI